MLNPTTTSKFEKEVGVMKKRNKALEKLKFDMSQLIEEQSLEKRFNDHSLIGNFIGRRECHIEPDWLLIYRIDGQDIYFERTGTHSDLF